MFDELSPFGKTGNYGIDIRVAEHVMGWERTNEEIYPGGAISSNYRSRAWRIPGRGLVAEESLPRFSGGIAAAWSVVEYLTNKGFFIDVMSCPDRSLWLKPPYEGAPANEWTLRPVTPDERYQCRISSSAPEYGHEWIVRADCQAKTAPLAICLSALKVSGASNEY